MAAAIFSQAPPPFLLLLLSSSFMSSFSAPLIIHLPEPSVGASLSFLLWLWLWHLAAASLRPAAVHRRRLASPNLPLLPSRSSPPSHFSPPPFFTLLIVICQPSQCPAPALHHCAASSSPPSLPPYARYCSPTRHHLSHRQTGRDGWDSGWGCGQERVCERRWEGQKWAATLMQASLVS